MGVNDVRPEAAECPNEVTQGFDIAEGRDRMHQAAQLDNLHALIHRGENLRPRLSAVDEHDGVPGAHGLVAGDDRVFIRTTIYETRDYMRNPQWPECTRHFQGASHCLALRHFKFLHLLRNGE
jgi:hypothetical protein